MPGCIKRQVKQSNQKKRFTNVFIANLSRAVFPTNQQPPIADVMRRIHAISPKTSQMAKLWFK
jgi:hypothetical protein